HGSIPAFPAAAAAVYTIYMGKDKYESEFHVDKLSSAHVYLRLHQVIQETREKIWENLGKSRENLGEKSQEKLGEKSQEKLGETLGQNSGKTSG
uniref:Uncharacterized protein n=1 Tax=Zonotrichia albicollis TaxID=44394 RepID=A0A8D2MEZ0_ZONAL